MKHIYTTLIFVLATLAVSADTIKAAKSADWNTNSTWNPQRQPQSGDSIIIPANITVTLDENENLDNVIIIVSGTIALNNGKLKLNSASRVIVQTTGKITGQNDNDQIQIGNTFKFKGTQLVQLGYSFADATTGTAPSGFNMVAAGALPVTFESFYATRQSQDVQLTWVTSEEVNNAYYILERSIDGNNWKQITMVMGDGTTTTTNRYAYTDKNITAAVVYYRICQTDVNGSQHYSAVRTVRSSNDQPVANIYVSAKQTITIDFNSDVKNNVAIQVVNMNGQVVARQQYASAAYRLTMNVWNANTGVYVVQVSDATGWKEVKKVVL